MLKVIIIFTLADICLSLVSIKIPLFRRNSKRWEEETYLQRFCNSFFVPLIVFVFLVMINSYRDAASPSRAEKMLNNDEVKYYLISDVNKIGNADIVYEIKKGTGQEEICAIISSICKELNKGSDDVYAYYEKEEFIIMDNGLYIGKAAISEIRYGTLLRFIWRK